jgi:hypothetical protein
MQSDQAMTLLADKIQIPNIENYLESFREVHYSNSAG